MAADGERADRTAALFALISAAVMIAQQVGSKATRDALFLSSFAAEDLPRVVIASAAASLVAVFLATRAYARFGPPRVVPFAFGISAALYVGEWLLVESATRPVAVVLYLHTAVFGALVISGFWSVVNERFDPHTAKTVVSRIGTGATFGGVAGGLLAERVGSLFDANSMLVVLAALNALAAFGVARVSPGGRRAAASPETSHGGLQILRRSPYLQGLAWLVLLTAISAGLLDYAFKAEAAAHFEQGSGDLLQFFAIFHVVAAILSLMLQTGLAKPALERLGVAGSAAMLPLVVLLTAAVGAGLTRLATVVVARASELVLANSIFRSGYELLYTPVSPAQKRPTKALIDVAGNRLGDALGSLVVLGVIAVAAEHASAAVLGLAAAFAVLSLLVARRLHRGYMGQLAESLRSGAPAGAGEELLQAATLQTLSTLGLDREALFEQLAAHQSWSERVSLSPEARPERPDDGIDAPADDPVHAQAKTLRDGDVETIRALLDEGPLDPRLYGHAIALLARRDVYPHVVKALRDVADDAVEPLVAALLDPDQPFSIRRRLPRVLQSCDDPRGAEGLTGGLDDERFEVRYRCALALARIAARRPERAPELERVHEAVRRELEAGRKVWDSRRLLDEVDEDRTPLLSERPPPTVTLGGSPYPVHRSVEHVFTLLSLGYDAEPLRLALYALGGEDKVMRGTALEYLDTLLPDDIRARLFPMLDARVEIRQRRDRQAIVEDLVRSMQALDVGELREAIEKAQLDESSPDVGD